MSEINLTIARYYKSLSVEKLAEHISGTNDIADGLVEQIAEMRQLLQSAKIALECNPQTFPNTLKAISEFLEEGK